LLIKTTQETVTPETETPTIFCVSITKPANEHVDPASEQNHIGPSGQNMDEFEFPGPTTFFLSFFFGLFL